MIHRFPIPVATADSEPYVYEIDLQGVVGVEVRVQYSEGIVSSAGGLANQEILLVLPPQDRLTAPLAFAAEEEVGTFTFGLSAESDGRMEQPVESPPLDPLAPPSRKKPNAQQSIDILLPPGARQMRNRFHVSSSEVQRLTVLGDDFMSVELVKSPRYGHTILNGVSLQTIDGDKNEIYLPLGGSRLDAFGCKLGQPLTVRTRRTSTARFVGRKDASTSDPLLVVKDPDSRVSVENVFSKFGQAKASVQDCIGFTEYDARQRFPVHRLLSTVRDSGRSLG